VTASVPLPDLLGVDLERARTAARTAVAAAITLCLVLIYRFPEGYWALITCIVMTQPSVGASLDKGIARILGTAVASFLAIVVLAPLNQDPIPFLAIVFVLVGLAAYLSLGDFQPYAFTIGGVTIVMIGELGFSGQNASVQLGLARTGEIVVGVLVSWFTAFALWPRRASEQREAGIEATIAGVGDVFADAAGAIVEGRDPPAKTRGRLEAIATRVQKLVVLLPAAVRESAQQRRTAAAQRRLAIQIARLRATVLPLAEIHDAAGNRAIEATRPELAAMAEAVHRAFVEVLGPARDAEDRIVAAIAPARARLVARWESLRERMTEVLPTGESLVFHGFRATMRELENTLVAIARTRRDIAEGAIEASAAWTWSSLTLPRPDPARLRFGIKTAVAVCFTLVLLNVLQWDSAGSALVTAFIVAQLSIGGTVRKAMFRLAGALTGGLLALFVIFAVTPHIVSLHAFALVVFVVLFGCAYVYSGPNQSAYVGFQGGLAFVMVLVAGPKQELSIMPAVYRLVGVMLGTGIMVVVESALWPVRAHAELRDRLRDSLRDLGVLFSEIARSLDGAPTDLAGWRHRGHEIRAGLDRCHQLLGEALLEGRKAREEVALDLRLTSATEELTNRISRLANRFDRPVHPDLRAALAVPVADLSERVRSTLAVLPERLDHPAPGLDRADAVLAASERLAAGLDEARATARFRSRSVEEVDHLIGLIEALERIAHGVIVVDEILSRRPGP